MDLFHEAGCESAVAMIATLKEKLLCKHDVKNPDLDTAEKLFSSPHCFLCQWDAPGGPFCPFVEESLEEHFAARHAPGKPRDEGARTLTRIKREMAKDNDEKKRELLDKAKTDFVKVGEYSGNANGQLAWLAVERAQYKCLRCARTYETTIEAMQRHIQEHEKEIPLVVYEVRGHPGPRIPACHEILPSGLWGAGSRGVVADADFPAGMLRTDGKIGCLKCAKKWEWSPFTEAKDGWSNRRRGMLLANVKQHIYKAHSGKEKTKK